MGTTRTARRPGGTARAPGRASADQFFFGYYLSLATMVRDEDKGELAEYVRRLHLCSCDHDPVPALVAVVVEMPKAQIPLGDVIW